MSTELDKESRDGRIKEVKAKTVTEAFEIRCGGAGSFSITLPK